MIKKLLLPEIEESVMIVEKGIQICDIEYILLYHYGFSYYNFGDPHQETQHKIGKLSDGTFHFSFYMDKKKTRKYMAKVDGDFNDDYVFDGKEMMCYSANQLLRSYKINNIKKKIKL